MKTRSEAGGRVPEARADKKRKRDQPDSVKIPVDVVNEVVLLAAAMVLLGSDPDAAGRLLRVPADSFFGAGHAPAWVAFQELHRRKLAYDPATVSQLSGGEVDTGALDGYVQDRPEPPPNLNHHVERVKWDRARVECVQGPLLAFIETLKDGQAEPSKLLALSRQIPAAFANFGDKRYLRDPQQLVREHALELTNRREGRAVYPYGIDALDNYGPGDVRVRSGKADEDLHGKPRMVPGMYPKDTTLITATSGGGKSTVAAGIVLAQYRMARKTLFGAWEVGSGRTLELMAIISLGWSRTDMMTGQFTADDQRLIQEEMERISEFVRFFDLPFGRKRGEREQNDRNLDLIQEHIADSGCDVFVADLFHMSIVEHGYGLESDALYRMHAITVEQRCHTVLLHQTNSKKTDAEEDQRPSRALLKGDGAWIEVSDTIIGCHIPGLSKDVPPDRIEFPILKQRYGVWPQLVECEFDPEFGWVGPGKTVPYVRNGADEGGDLLGQSLTRRSKFGGARGNKKR